MESDRLISHQQRYSIGTGLGRARSSSSAPRANISQANLNATSSASGASSNSPHGKSRSCSTNSFTPFDPALNRSRRFDNNGVSLLIRTTLGTWFSTMDIGRYPPSASIHWVIAFRPLTIFTFYPTEPPITTQNSVTPIISVRTLNWKRRRGKVGSTMRPFWQTANDVVAGSNGAQPRQSRAAGRRTRCGLPLTAQRIADALPSVQEGFIALLKPAHI